MKMMKHYIVLLSTIVLMLLCVESHETSFQNLGEEFRTLLSNQNVQQIMAPVSSSLNETTSSVFNDLQKMLTILKSLDNSLASFHSIVDSGGGLVTFQSAGDTIVSSYFGGLIGHMNPENTESSKMAEITNSMQSLFNLTVVICYQNLYTVVNTDIVGNDLFGDMLNLASLAGDIGSDVKNLIEQFKEIFSGNKLILLEHFDQLHDTIAKSMDSQDTITKENFICKIQPTVEKIVDIVAFFSADDVRAEFTDLSYLLDNITAPSTIVRFTAGLVNHFVNMLNTYGVTFTDTILPITDDVVDFAEQLCAGSSNSNRRRRLSSAQNFNPIDFLSKTLDLIEGGIKVIENLPESLKNDTENVIYDIVEYVAPNDLPEVKQAIADVKDIGVNFDEITPLVNTVLADFQTLMTDTGILVGNLKIWATTFIALIKLIV